jgi:CheY-like chemotaxis protein
LEEERCDIQTAASGIDAMEWLDRQEFDVIVSDVVMPDMDGYQLYQTVKKKMPNLPVVLMTAFNYDRDHIIKRSCLEGLQGVIFKKPVNPVILKKLLLQQCRAEQAKPQLSAAAQSAIASSENPKAN